MPKTQGEVCSFVQLCNFHVKSTHHFSDLSASLTDLLKRSKPQKIVMMPLGMEALRLSIKHRLIFAPCLVLPEGSLDVKLVIASTVGISAVLLQIMEEVFNKCLAKHQNLTIKTVVTLTPPTA
jgi:hypothetical protein